MKKIIVLVITIFAFGNLFSQGIEFEHGTFQEAIAKAKKENKLVFMDCYTSWCGPCKYLSTKIFTQKEVGDFFNKNFVSFKLDCEKGEGPDLANKYGVSSYPTLLFIDAEGNTVHKLVGGMPAEDLIDGAKSALDPSMRIGALKDKFQNGNREYAFLMTYLTAVKREYDRENIVLVSNEMIKKYSLEKFLEKDLFYVAVGANVKYDSKEFQYLLKNKEAVTAKIDTKEYDSVIEGAIGTHLSEYVQTCESLTALDNEIDKCKKEQICPHQEEFEKSLRYEFYIANDQLNTWFDLKLEDAEKQKESQNYVYYSQNR